MVVLVVEDESADLVEVLEEQEAGLLLADDLGGNPRPEKLDVFVLPALIEVVRLFEHLPVEQLVIVVTGVVIINCILREGGPVQSRRFQSVHVIDNASFEENAALFHRNLCAFLEFLENHVFAGTVNSRLCTLSHRLHGAVVDARKHEKTVLPDQLLQCS